MKEIERNLQVASEKLDEREDVINSQRQEIEKHHAEFGNKCKEIKALE